MNRKITDSQEQIVADMPREKLSRPIDFDNCLCPWDWPSPPNPECPIHGINAIRKNTENL